MATIDKITVITQPIQDESGHYYTSHIIEFEGCMADGDTEIEALENLQQAMALWIETKTTNGFPVPAPMCPVDASMKK